MSNEFFFQINTDTKSIFYEARFEEIYPFWRTYLWPNRQSQIEPTSAIDSSGEIDVNIMQYKPLFILGKQNNSVVCGISGHQTCLISYRLRGVFVNEECKGQGLGKQLVQTQIEQARRMGLKFIWLLSRQTNIEFYKKLGFEETLLITKYEYGPHSIMKYKLAT